HQLEGWSFQFDHATKRAGCGNDQTRVISLAHAYARYAGDEAIDDTLLHEVAHALVGQAHGHDQVWQATAVALGCAGQRCHDVQFTPPRYIVTCDNAGFVANFAQEVMKGQWPLSVGKLRGQGIELFGRSAALCSSLYPHLSFL